MLLFHDHLFGLLPYIINSEVFFISEIVIFIFQHFVFLLMHVALWFA